MSITTRSAVQTGQTRWSREASVTLISPYTAHCDGIAWVSLLSGESWGTLRTGNTLEKKEKRQCSVLDYLIFVFSF